MSSKKIIVVFGATGTTGGSVAKYLLEDGTFAVRAVTRNANSEKAKALKAAGAEVVEADSGKAETLPAALAGAYGVSGLTDFWAIFPTSGPNAEVTQAEEERQGRNIVDAAKAAGIKHFVWFSLWHSDCPHWEGKYNIEQYLKASGVPYTSVYNACYFENLSNPAFGMFKKEGDQFVVAIPQPADTYAPFYSADQSGGWVLPAFKNPDKWLGKQIITLGEHITPNQMGKVLTKYLGSEVKVQSPTKDEFYAMASTENPFVKELFLNMKGFVEHCQPPNSWYLTEEESKAIYPGQYNFEQFLNNNEGFHKYLASLRSA